MTAAVFAYTRSGCALARDVRAALPEAEVRLYAPARLAEEDLAPLPSPAAPVYRECFSNHDALIFIGAAGIAVRAVAPYVRSKATDPAVLCLDEGGRYVIPLLSGHLGGANALARRLGNALDALAVVTTATDGRGRVSIDQWAAERGYLIDDLAAAKAVSAAVLEDDVPFCCDVLPEAPLPPGLVPGEDGPLGVYLGVYRRSPFERTLRLIPKALHVGLGCRKGISAETVKEAALVVLSAHELDPRAVALAASIDRKAEEPGLLAACRDLGWPTRFYSAEALAEVAGDFTASAFVESVTGVDNVCERAALLGADRLLVRKCAGNGVTVAVAVERFDIR